MSIKRFVAVALVLGLGSTVSGDTQQFFKLPLAVVTGTEKIGWDQPAGSVDELDRLSYAIYVDDGPRTPLTGASCNPTRAAAGFQCVAPLPPLSAGSHALDLVAIVRYGDLELSSAKSRFLVTVTAPASSRSMPAYASPPQSAPFSPAFTLTTQDGVHLAIEQYAGGLDTLVAMAFVPDGSLFVVERTSGIRMLGNGHPAAEPALALSDVLDPGEVGAFEDIAIHPDFERNHQVYVLYIAHVPGEIPTYRLARFRELQGVLAERVVVLDRIPASARQLGATVRFGPDRCLYLGIEDLASKSAAQDLGSLNGKILRLNADGTVPRDNPFPSPVFSYGHSAPVGLAWQPKTGDLWEVERGLTEQDELNLVMPRTNYGWPDERLAPGDSGQVRVDLGRSISPAGAMFYTGSLIPGFRNDLFFASTGSRSLYRVRFDRAHPRRVVSIETLLDGQFGRLGGVVGGPDGALYVFTSNRASAGEARPQDDRVLRMVPVS